MSGGSLNYVYSSVDSTAFDVERRAETLLHHAFAAHLRKVAKALHDLEWVWSSDYGPGDEVEAIRAVLGEGAEIEAATERAEKALADLKSALSANAQVERPGAASGARSARTTGCASNGNYEERTDK